MEYLLNIFATPSLEMVGQVFSLVAAVLKLFGLGWVPVAFLLLFWATWVFYLAIMNLKRVRDAKQEKGEDLSGLSKLFGYPTALIGIVSDWFLNLCLTIPFVDIPAALGELVTGRLIRYANGRDGWRKRIALWLGKDFLDDYDPSGVHIKVNHG